MTSANLHQYLMNACMTGNVGSIAYLVDQGLDIETIRKDNNAALKFCVFFSKLGMIRSLVRQGLNESDISMVLCQVYNNSSGNRDEQRKVSDYLHKTLNRFGNDKDPFDFGDDKETDPFGLGDKESDLYQDLMAKAVSENNVPAAEFVHDSKSMFIKYKQ